MNKAKLFSVASIMLTLPSCINADKTKTYEYRNIGYFKQADLDENGCISRSEFISDTMKHDKTGAAGISLASELYKSYKKDGPDCLSLRNIEEISHAHY